MLQGLREALPRNRCNTARGGARAGCTGMSYRCLIIEQAGPRRDDLDAELRRHGIGPSRVPGIAAARALLTQWRFDALLGLGDALAWPASGARGGAPLLVLCAAGAGEAPALRALEAGATDGVGACASAAFVAVKLLRLIECATPPAPGAGAAIRVGSLQLDRTRASARVAGVPLALTPAEFELLLALALRPGEIVRRAAIAAARGPARRIGRSVDSQVCRLRKCLQEAGADDLELLTIYGIGYCLSPRGINAFPEQSMQRRPARASLA